MRTLSFATIFTAALVGLLTACGASAADGSAGPVLDRSNLVAGIDANHNNVRDDLEAYIANLPDTAAQKLALMQLAAAYTEVLTVDTTSKPRLFAAGESMSRAISCIFRKYDERTADVRTSALEKYSVNTRVRFYAYDRFNSAMSGSTFRSPADGGCETASANL